MFSIGIIKRQQATGHGFILQFIVHNIADQYGTGAAVTFPAADLGTRQLLMIADKIQQGRPGAKPAAHLFIIKNKTYQWMYLR